MVDKLRLGVVGVGHLGEIHAAIYSRMPNVDLVGVVDVDYERAAQIATKHGCDIFEPGSSLMNKVDAVSIAVPTTFHCAVAMPILLDGIPVLLEKPIAHTLDDARKIVETAALKGVILQIGHLERFNAGVIRLTQELDEPRFIEVHRLGEFVERASDVDVVTDLMIHDIDIVLSLVSANLKYVSAVGTPVITDHVDIANARLEFQNGAIANVTASRVSRTTFRRIRIFGRSCYLGLNFKNQQIDVMRPGQAPSEGGFSEMVAETIEVDPRPPLDAELEHFVQCIIESKTPLVSGTEGIRALEVAHQVRIRINDSL
tara:strand:+ start:1824 stop:2768 length:945 start_codon:yes stop_codon:yes gene_type:complete